MLYARRIGTALGEMLVAVDDADALVALEFCANARPEDLLAHVTRPDETVEWSDERGKAVVAQLEEYFRGERRAFDLALAPRGSEFQRRVWQELTRIPYGTTISYGELARRVGKRSATASRAIGQANASNPIAVVVPCHRVIGRDGRLTGYAAGLSFKAKLLTLEGALAPDELIAPRSHRAIQQAHAHAGGPPRAARVRERPARAIRPGSPDQADLFPPS